MKLFCKLILFLSFTIINLVSAEQDLKSLINQLGAQSYQERETATKAIWAMGNAALDELKKAAKSPDPEIADRAQELLARIELGITPETPKELFKVFQNFHDSNDQERGQMLIELSRQKKGWLTIRTLLLKSLDQDLADIILSPVDSRMVINLRDQNRHEDAGAILELAVIFGNDDAWINHLLTFADENNLQKEILNRFENILKLLDKEKNSFKAAILQTQTLLYRSIGKYKEAALKSRKFYKLAFEEDSDFLKAACKPLFIECHLLADMYAYLEQFWEKTSLDIPEKNRLWNILWLQRMQAKSEAYKQTKTKLNKLLNNKNDYLTFTTILLLNGELQEAQEILLQYENFEVLADLAQNSLDYPLYQKWLTKAADKNEDFKLELFTFEAKNKNNADVKDQLLKAINKRSNKSEKLTAILYLEEAGYKKEAQAMIQKLLLDEDLEDNDALRAAWALSGSRTLAELFIILRDKSKNKTAQDAIDLIKLLALTDDPDSFVEYVKILEENFEGFSREMKQITYTLGRYCLEKDWNSSAAAVMAILEPAQRGLFNSLLESEAHIRDRAYTKAVHNLLGPTGTPKLSLPYYVVAQAYALNQETDKQQKALQFAYSYDVGRENLSSMTSEYLYENGHYEYFLETAGKQCRVGGAMSPYRTRAYKLLSSSHIHNLKHSKAKPYFMAYYKLASSDLTLIQGGPREAMRMGYQYHEFKLREAVNKQDDQQIISLAAKCQELFLNNIEVPILLNEAPYKTAKQLHKKYFNLQWENMLSAIELLPNHAILLNSAAWLGALNDHELEQCLKMVQKAIDLDPSAANYDTRAEVQYRLKLYKEAVESIEKAASLDKLEPFFRDRVDKFRKAAENAK